MADANHKAVAPVTQRILTISSQSRPRPMTYAPAHIELVPDLPPAPWISLREGGWKKRGLRLVDGFEST